MNSALRQSSRAAVFAGLILLPGMALSHFTGAVHSHEGVNTAGAAFAHGSVHPFTGLDHILAMLAVGLWASSGKTWQRFAAVGAFVWLMVVGALIGMMIPGLPIVESLIAATVIVGGGILIIGKKFTTTLGLCVAAGFALVHGYAHGAEIGSSLALTYFAGFALSSAILCTTGIGLGALVAAYRKEDALRYAGAAIALTGGLILGGVV
jgi:urease accessory protein